MLLLDALRFRYLRQGPLDQLPALVIIRIDLHAVRGLEVQYV